MSVFTAKIFCEDVNAELPTHKNLPSYDQLTPRTGIFISFYATNSVVPIA
jgi:hypothetical protein